MSVVHLDLDWKYRYRDDFALAVVPEGTYYVDPEDDRCSPFYWLRFYAGDPGRDRVSREFEVVCGESEDIDCLEEIEKIAQKHYNEKVKKGE